MSLAAVFSTLPGCGPWPLLAGLCLALNLFTWAAYGRDKWAARRGGRRTPEIRLHLLALAGGWPGAWLAQHSWRHKRHKPAFVRVFWATVLGNLLALGGLGWGLARWGLLPGLSCSA